MNEVWLPIDGYEGLYEISSHGRVRNSKGRELIPAHHHRSKAEMAKRNICNPYLVVRLHKNSVTCKHRVHRLVARAFLDNPYNHPIVNHIDENQLNNRVENLEWCSVSENTKHSSHKWSGDNHYTKKE